jgi:hypothetical protein
MRKGSQQRSKEMPTYEQLEAALAESAMTCPDCKCDMKWRTDDDGRRNVVSVQHWDDGAIGFICMACNARRNYREELPPEGQRRCHKCGENKPLDDFYAHSRSGKVSACKPCWKLHYDHKRTR